MANMILLVDIGNTRLKWGTLIDNQFHYGGACCYSVPELPQCLTTLWQALSPPTAVLVSNVAGEKAAQVFSEWIKETYALTPYFTRSQRYCGQLRNGYTIPQQFGIDRWMALIAAWEQFGGPFCVIACGTATTVDVVDSQGNHLGGLIVPGLESMKIALIETTHGCKKINKLNHCEPPTGLLAQDTYHAVIGGAYYMTAAFIHQMIHDLQAEVSKDLTCVLTGGDALNLAPLLTHSFQHSPYLVLEGLACIAKKRPQADSSTQGAEFSIKCPE